jgi:hypothetical protein
VAARKQGFSLEDMESMEREIPRPFMSFTVFMVKKGSSAGSTMKLMKK